MLTSILTALAPVFVFMVQKFVANERKAQDIIRSYYAFLDANDNAIEKKVENNLKLRRARRKKQQQLLDEKRQRDLKKKQEKSNE